MVTAKIIRNTLTIIGTVVHLWTFAIAFMAGSGLFALGMTFLFPVLSWIYWIWDLWGSAYSKISIIYMVLISIYPFTPWAWLAGTEKGGKDRF